MAGEKTARGRELHERELAVRSGLEGDEGVGVDLRAVLGIDVRHLCQCHVAVRRDEEFVVGRDGDFSRGAVLCYCWVGGGAVRALLVDLLERESPRANVGNFIRDDLGDKLVDDEEVGLRAGLPEGGVAGAVAGGGFELGVLDEFARGAIDAEDVGYVEAEVGEDHVLAGGVEDGVVDVRAVLLLGLRAGCPVFVADVLEELEGAIVEAPGGEAVAAVVGNGQVLVGVVELGSDGAASGDVVEGGVLDASVAVEGEGVQAGVVGGVPGLVEGDGLALEVEIDPGGLGTALGVLGCLLQRAIGVVERVDVTIGDGGRGGTVSANEDLDGRRRGRKTCDEEGAERHCERASVELAVRMLCGERNKGGDGKYIQEAHVNGLVKEQRTAEAINARDAAEEAKLGRGEEMEGTEGVGVMKTGSRDRFRQLYDAGSIWIGRGRGKVRSQKYVIQGAQAQG